MGGWLCCAAYAVRFVAYAAGCAAYAAGCAAYMHQSDNTAISSLEVAQVGELMMRSSLS